MKKLKSLFKKHGARIGAFVMCFMLLIPMLCSMASTSASVSVTIENPDNLPQDFTFLANPDADLEGGVELSFGQSFVDSDVITVKDGRLDDMPVDLADGDYITLLIMVLQEEGYYAGVQFNGEPIVINGLNAYLTTNPTVTVIERNTDGIILDGAMFLVPLPPSPTDSITSVWTSITNWVISSLNTVQGVFVNSGIHYYVNEYPEFALTYDGNSYGAIDYDEFFSYRYMWYDGHRIDSMSELTQTVITVNGTQFGAYSYDGTVLAFSDGVNYMAIDNGLLGVSNTPNPNSLTLLGTLAVIGLSISLAFLLIGVISRFLKSRG